MSLGELETIFTQISPHEIVVALSSDIDPLMDRCFLHEAMAASCSYRSLSFTVSISIRLLCKGVACTDINSQCTD